MNRTNQILVGILVLQIAFTAFTWKKTDDQGPKLKPLLNVKSDAVTSIQISFDVSTEKERRSRALKMSRKAGAWVVSDADDFPVDGSKVEALIERLVSSRVGTPIARKKGNHNALNVGDKAYGKHVELEAGDQAFKLVIGRARGASMHVRFADQEDVYLLKGMNADSVGGRIANYADSQYVRVEEPTEIRIVNEYGPIDLTMDPSGKWRVEQLPPDAVLDQARIRSFVSSISSVRMENPVGKTTKPWWRLDTSPRITIAVSNPMTSVEYRVGAAERGLLYVKSLQSDYVVQVQKYTLESLITQTPDMFIDNTPTPTSP